MMRTIQISAVLAAVATLMLALSPALADERATWPTQSWPTATPEASGLDSVKLAGALKAIKNEVPHVHAVLIERRGRVFLDAAFYPYDGKQPHNVASVTKSIMTALIAIAAQQGKLRLDQPALSFFPDLKIANRDARKERITVRQLTGMVSGLDCVGEHDEPTLHQMNASRDWVQFALDLKMVEEPGTTFSYCSPGMHLLSAILTKATGMTALEFARANLFGPLGIHDVLWPSDPQGYSHGWGDLHLMAGDAAKIGHLWLNMGNWNGNQIVSKDWVRQSSSLQIKTSPPWGDDYGYGWWIMSGDEIPQYSAAGRGGQRIGVFPTLDLVAVTFGGGIEPGDVLDRIGAALVSPDKPLPPNPNGEKELQSALASLSRPAPPKPLKPLPQIAATISGRLYVLEPNPFMLKSVRLDFDATDTAQMALVFADGQPSRNNAIGLDDVYRMSPGENGLTVGARGTWQDDSTFAIEYDAIASIDAFDIRIRFEGERISFQAKERTYEQGVNITGRLAP